jgi:ATP-dependent Lon protease
MQKYQNMLEMTPSSDEYHKVKGLIDAVCSIPFGVYKQLPVHFKSPKHDIRSFLIDTRKNLDEKIYGHQEAKDYIVRLLAQWIVNPDSKGLVLGIQGDAGVGKTTLVKEGISAALNLPFSFIPLGGANESMYLEGLTYSYAGSTWGRIIDSVMRAGCMNPVLFFDELDKVSTTNRGQDVINILMHLTDSTQNDKYHDKYFTDFDFDLSKCIIIFTYNDENAVNPILRDRMIKIYTKGYNSSDKLQIAKHYMIPSILTEFNMKPDQVIFTDNTLLRLIDMVDKEEGVRNLRRAIHCIVSNINYKYLTTVDDATEKFQSYTVRESDIDTFIGQMSTNQKENNMSLKMMYM